MPYLMIQTSQSVDEKKRQAILQKASQRVAEILGKPERYVMVALETDTPMIFDGSSDPTAYLEMKSIDLPEATTPELSTALCDFVEENLAVRRNRVYIEFTNAAGHLWGWDGRTF